MTGVAAYDDNDRRCFIGGSDAAAVLGVSEWTTPARLWRLKTGRDVEKVSGLKRQRALERGRKLEPFIRDMVIDRLQEEGHDVELLQCNRRYVDPEFEFLRAEVDFELSIDGVHTNVDAKSASGFMRQKWGAEGTDEFPVEYAAQFAHQMMVTGRGRTLIAALIGLDDVRIYWQQRDEQIINGLRAKEVLFWERHVRQDLPPDPTIFADLVDRYPNAADRTVEASEAVADLVDELRQVRRNMRELVARDLQLCLDIGRYMKDATRLSVGGELAITWGNERRRQFLVEQFRAKHPDHAAMFTEETTPRVMRVARLRGRR